MEEEEKRELQQIMTYLEIVNSQIESLTSQAELLDLSHQEHSRARETIDNLTKQASGDELLVPIGANNFIFANIKDPDKIFFELGSNISTVLTCEQAISKLDDRLAQIDEGSNKIIENITNLKQQAAQLSQRGRQLYEQLQQEEGPTNV